MGTKSLEHVNKSIISCCNMTDSGLILVIKTLSKYKRLSEWKTLEETFAEYKIRKQADICLGIAKYKERIQEYIYDAFLRVDVKPY